jgi:hypothetical protein
MKKANLMLILVFVSFTFFFLLSCGNPSSDMFTTTDAPSTNVAIISQNVTYDFSSFTEFNDLVKILKATIINDGVIVTLRATTNIQATAQVTWDLGLNKDIRIDLNNFEWHAEGNTAFSVYKSRLNISNGYLLGNHNDGSGIYGSYSFLTTDSAKPIKIGKLTNDGFFYGIAIDLNCTVYMPNIIVKNNSNCGLIANSNSLFHCTGATIINNGSYGVIIATKSCANMPNTIINGHGIFDFVANNESYIFRSGSSPGAVCNITIGTTVNGSLIE